jgi:hypothetical protein
LNHKIDSCDVELLPELAVTTIRYETGGVVELTSQVQVIKPLLSAILLPEITPDM